MHLSMTHLCGLLCLSLGVRSEWSPKVQKVLDKSPIGIPEVKPMLREQIFTNDVNCGKGFGQESSEVFSPSVQCDQAGMTDLQEGYNNYDNFNKVAFMQGFWGSTVGGNLLKYFQGRGVSDGDLRDAMDEFWFTEDDGITAFKRIFFDSEEREMHHRYTNWYTFDMAVKAQHLQCRTEKSRQAKSVTVQMFCSGENYYTNANWEQDQAAYATFPYPSHPYENIISYTICSWSNSETICVSPTPGGKFVNIKVSKSQCSNSNYDCLKSIFVY